MKYHGCIMDFTEVRNVELLKAFREACRRYPLDNIPSLMRYAVKMPCSRFWVSDERALFVISAISRGVPILDSMRPTKRRLFAEIYRRCREISNNNPDLTLKDVIARVVHSPAPEFYMAPGFATKLYSRIKQSYRQHHAYH